MARGVMVTIRAYNAEGYQKDIALISEQQVHMTESRVDECAFGVSIDPSKFPEMVRFEVIVRETRG